MLVTYFAGTALNLGAVPGPGSVFVGWTGGGCSGTAGCSVKLNADVTVTATFVASSSLTIGTSQTIKYGSSLAASPSSRTYHRAAHSGRAGLALAALLRRVKLVVCRLEDNQCDR